MDNCWESDPLKGLQDPQAALAPSGKAWESMLGLDPESLHAIWGILYLHQEQSAMRTRVWALPTACRVTVLGGMGGLGAGTKGAGGTRERPWHGV